MPLPRGLARFNRRVTNRAAVPLARRVPPFVLLEHRGRRTGTEYATPLAAFRRGETYALALTYGPGADWVRNVLAAGGCTLVRAGRREVVQNARVARGPAGLAYLPWPVRRFLELTGIEDVLLLDRVGREQHRGHG